MRRVDGLALCGRGRPFHSGVSDPDRLFAQQLEEHLGNCAKWAGTTRAPPPPPVAVAGSPRPCARYGPSPSRRAVTSTYGIGCWNKPAGAGQAIHAQRHQPPAAPGGGDRRPAAGSDHQEPTPAAHRPRTHHYASSGAEPPVRAHPRRRPRTPAATAARLVRLPALLRPAAGTKGGQRRLRRFLEAVRYPTLTTFARDAGLDPGTVTLQIHKLEQDLDGELLSPAKSNTPCSSPALARRSWPPRRRIPTSPVISTDHATNRRPLSRPSCDGPRA
jgi:hypothetical protein